MAYRGIMPDDVIAKTDLAYRTQFWAERIADPDWPVFVIEEGGECVAFCQMIRPAIPTTIRHRSVTLRHCTCCRSCAAGATAASSWITSSPNSHGEDSRR